MQVSVRGEGSLGAGGDIKGNAIGAGSSATYIEHQTVHQAVPWEGPAWPVLIGVIPARAGYYQRRPETEVLAGILSDGGAAVPCQVVTGTGGVGKTQLAADYARFAWDRIGASVDAGREEPVPDNASNAENIELLVWVNATSSQAITSVYALAAQVVVPGGAVGLDADQAAQRFLTWLRSTARRWLVVLDDVAQPGALTGLWPPEVAVGRVVVTTRSRDAAWSSDTRKLVQIGLFTPEQSAEYLRQALARPGREGHADSDGDIAAMADDLGNLPLALAQAAAYLVDTGRSIPRYRALLADRVRTLAHLMPDIGGLPDTQTHTVNAAWDMSLALADGHQPAGVARPLMELASVLDPNSMPSSVLTSAAARDYLCTHRAAPGGSTPSSAEAVGAAEAGQVDEVDAEDALRILHRLNLLDHDFASGTLRVHQLIQRAVREHAGCRGRLPELTGAGADALAEIWPDIERDTAFALTLRANADALLSGSVQGLWQDGAHPVLFRAGRSLGEAGQVEAAIAHFEHLANAADRNLGSDHPHSLACRHETAFWRGQTGDAAGALAAYERLLVEQLHIQGSDHPDTLATRHEIAHWRGEVGNLAAALATTEELLADQVRILGPDHPRTLSTRGNLAGRRGQMGDVAAAITAYEHLLDDRVRVLGADHPDTLATRHQIAHWRGEAGDLESAANAYKEVLAGQLRVLGPDHPDTLVTRNNLAATQGYAGDAAGAVSAFEELLKELGRVVGPDHPYTLATRGNLAFWRGQTGDLEGAAIAYEELLVDRLGVLGADHPDSLATRSDQAAVRGELGDAAGAASALEEVLAGRVRVLGPDHPSTLATRSDLAGWRGEAGDVAGAFSAAEELLADQIRILGPDHPDTLATRNNLAGWRGAAGDSAGAVAAFEELLTAQLRILGSDHPDCLTTRSNLAGFRGEAGDAVGAVAEFEELLAGRVRILGPDHPDTLATRSNLAAWHGHAGNVKMAVAAFKVLLADMMRVLGPSHPATLNALSCLAYWTGEAHG
ncbi:hypothetical protein BG452_20485 [Streptomyces sp. CBMA123]|nr:hypothetical protein [Streptomyces sp. CBMA123]